MLAAREAYCLSRANTKIDKRITTQMLDRCAAEVRSRARQGDTHCTFAVPLVKFGLPLYDARRITDYVGWTLEKQGYRVERLGPTSLLVSWSDAAPPEGDSLSVKGSKAPAPNLRAALALARSLGKHKEDQKGRDKKRH